VAVAVDHVRVAAYCCVGMQAMARGRRRTMAVRRIVVVAALVLVTFVALRHGAGRCQKHDQRCTDEVDGKSRAHTRLLVLTDRKARANGST